MNVRRDAQGNVTNAIAAEEFRRQAMGRATRKHRPGVLARFRNGDRQWDDADVRKHRELGEFSVRTQRLAPAIKPIAVYPTDVTP